MNFRPIVAFSVMFTFCSALPAQADPELRAKIESLSKLAPETIIAYRWQSQASGDTLLREKTFTDKLYDYFMGMKVDKDHFTVGRGIYVSENPYSSSQYVRGSDDGSLIQVRIEKGTPVIDLSDPGEKEVLEKNGISEDQVYSLDPRVAVKYNGNEQWWVLKGQQGISFQRFDGSNLQDTYLINVYE